MFDYCWCPGDLGGAPCGFCCARVRWLTLLIAVLVRSFDLAFNILECSAFGMLNTGYVANILRDSATMSSEVVSPVAWLDDAMVGTADARNPRRSVLISEQSGLQHTVGCSEGSPAVVVWKVYEEACRRLSFYVDIGLRAGAIYGSSVTGKLGLLPTKPDIEDQNITISALVSPQGAWPRFASAVRDACRLRMLFIKHRTRVGHGARYLEPWGWVSATDVLSSAHKFVQQPTATPGPVDTYGSPTFVPLLAQNSTLGGFGEGGLQSGMWRLDFLAETPQGDDRTAAPLNVSQWLWALSSPTAEINHGCTKNLPPTTQGDLGPASESFTCSYRGPVTLMVKRVWVVSNWCGARVAAAFEHTIKRGMYLCLKIKLVRPPSAMQWAGLTSLANRNDKFPLVPDLTPGQ